MSRRVRPRLVAAALTLALSISACGGDDGSGETAASSKVAGATVAGPGYELTVPAGWRTSSKTAEELRLKAGRANRDLAVVSISRSTAPPPDATLPQLSELLRQRLLATVPGLSPSDLGEFRPASLGEVPARAYEAAVRFKGQDATVRAVFTLRDGALYSALLTAAPDDFEARETDYESMLESWRWKHVAPAEATDPSADAGDGEIRPAKGAPVVGSGYKFNLPRGWRTVDLGRTPPGLEVPDGYKPPDVTVRGKMIKGSPVIASVLVEPTSSTSLDEFVKGEGARYFSAGAPPTGTSLGGAPAVVATGDREGIGTAPMRSETLAALHDGNAYFVDFSAPRDRFEKQVKAFRAAMASWQWQ